MMLLWILLIPLLGGVAAMLVAGRPGLPRIVAASALGLDAFLLASLWIGASGGRGNTPWPWIAEWSVAWVPQVGIRFALAVDGLALIMSLLACVVGMAALLANVASPRAAEGRYTALLMASIFAILGVFLASDMALFFVFYELMLVPAYLLIIGWGTANRSRTALRFFLFTQTGGLLMLISILGLYATHIQVTGVRTFGYVELLHTRPEEPIATLFLIGFFLAFAVKLPLVPFHTWQADAYANASTESSIIFSALMSKTAGFGLLRYAIPLLPESAERMAPTAMAFGVLTILYASWVAFGQSDLKRLIAYSSAAHLGYIVLGAFSMNELGRQGVVVQMVCHGLSVTGLFLIADMVERRTGTREIGRLGGLWKSSPRTGAIALVCVMATLGLPGLGNFIGEFLILAGTFAVNPIAAALGALGAVLAAAYALRVMQRAFFGPSLDVARGPETHPVALGVCAALIAVLVVLGVYPQPLLNLARQGTVVFAGHPTADLGERR